MWDTDTHARTKPILRTVLSSVYASVSLEEKWRSNVRLMLPENTAAKPHEGEMMVRESAWDIRVSDVGAGGPPEGLRVSLLLGVGSGGDARCPEN